jgi:AAA+ superfamily predicted ATPase
MIRYNGERIESIRERFEVEIDFSLAVPESNKRIITLYGSPCMSVSAYSQLMQM